MLVYVDDSSTRIFDGSSSVGTYGSSELGRYESSTGHRYEYDLSDPGDQIEYSIDVDAQMRDLDRGLGEYGGGIYN